MFLSCIPFHTIMNEFLQAKRPATKRPISESEDEVGNHTVCVFKQFKVLKCVVL